MVANSEISAESISRFLLALYAAGENPARWQDAMTAAMRLFGANAGQVYEFDPKIGSMKPLADHGFPHIEVYFEGLRFLGDPRVEWTLGVGRTTVWHDGLVFKDHDPNEWEFNRWVQSILGRHTAYGTACSDPDGAWQAFSICAFGRTAQQPTTEVIACLTDLLPHFQNAFRMNRRLGLAAAAWDALDHIATGVVYFDANGRVVAANFAAETMSRDHDGLGLDKSGLKASKAAENRSLDKALKKFLEISAGRLPSSADQSDHVVRISRPSGKLPYAVSFNLCPTAAALGAWSGAPAVMAIIADLAAETAHEPDVLSILFGFTEAEARVAALLSEGLAPSAIAENLGVSINTVRFHLRGCYAKTATSGQAELVAKIK